MITPNRVSGTHSLRVWDLDHLKRVIDTIRRSAGVAATKTLIVLGSTSGQNGVRRKSPT